MIVKIEERRKLNHHIDMVAYVQPHPRDRYGDRLIAVMLVPL